MPTAQVHLEVLKLENPLRVRMTVLREARPLCLPSWLSRRACMRTRCVDFPLIDA